MARRSRLGQGNNWRFSDAGVKFDGRPRPQRRSNQKPISPALKRGVIHCSRCGSRVVSNVDNCPFCGRSLRPFFARFWFWLLVVVLVALVVIFLVNTSLPHENTTPTGPTQPDLPQVIGGSADSSLKNLTLGTSIDNSGLEVTVRSVTPGPLAANGWQIYIVDVDFINNRSTDITIYSTQWMLELSDGIRLDTFIGSDADGTTLASNFSDYELASKGRFSGRLFFAVAPVYPTEEEIELGIEAYMPYPVAVVYQPSALAYSEDLLVSWQVSYSAE